MSEYDGTGGHGHRCPAPGCRAQVPGRFVMCRKHWPMVDWELRDWMMRYYRSNTPWAFQFDEFIAALKRAVDSLNAKRKHGKKKAEAVTLEE